MNKLSNKFCRLGLAAALLVLISTQPARSAITDGVVAYWNFDAADFKDSVGLNGVKFDGTAHGANPIPFQAGKAGFGQAIQLDGVDQWVEITGGEPDDLGFAGGSVSISAWFKVGTFDKSWQAMVAKGEGSNWRIHRRNAENGMAFTGGPSGDTPTGTKDVNDDAWHHLVAITDAAAVNFGTALYVDGELYSKLDPAQVLAVNGLRMAIGDNPGARGRYWNGWLDDVAIWNRVLTPAEIASLYFSGAGKPLSSFLGPHVDTIVAAKGASEPDNVQVLIIDDGTAVFDPNAAANLNVKVDGTALPPTSKSKSGTTSLMNFKKQFYTSTSQVQVYVEAKDTNGKWTTNQLAFTIPTYPTIPSGYKLAAPATTPGMVAQIYQIDFARTPSSDENSVASAEQQLARGFPVAGGTPHPNVAGQASDNTVSVVNWARFNDLTGDYNINATPANGPDNFNDARPTNAPVPNVTIPGLPGTGSDQGHGGTDAGSAWDNIVVETTAYMRLTRGAYQMGVNSDDGFKVTTSPAAEDPFGLLLGQFSGTRGSANTTFWFVVLEDGDYPVRLLWWQGAGGGSVEWFVTDRNTGSRVLVNAAGSPITTFRQGSGHAHVKSILPANGFDGVEPNSPIKIVLVDGSTTVVNGSISLTVDGSPVTPTISSGATTTVTYNAPSNFGDSRHTGRLVWGESTTPQTMHTNDFSFQIRAQSVDDLPSYTQGTFAIEAEDFDGPGDDQARATVSTMPYAGLAYQDLGAVHDVDYHANDNGPFNGTPPDPNQPSAHNYRTGIPSELNGPNRYVPMDANQTVGTLDVQRPGFEVTSNFKLGWVDNGEWYNYTRTNIPAGIYTAFGAFSHGDVNADVGGTLARVTAGVGTSNQTLVTLGSFTGPAPGGWGNNALVPLKTSAGERATFKLPAGVKTLRVTTRNGDYDWFALVPVTGVQPAIISVTPPLEHTVFRNTTITWTIEDFSTAVQTNSIKLSFGGADVTPQLSITKPATDLTTVTYTPAQMLNAGGSYPYSLVFRDNGTPQTSKTNSGTVVAHYLPRTAVDGAFAIEAEDFNFNSGQYSNLVNTMPYAGGAYTNLGAVIGVDYQRANEPSGDIYRIGEAPNVPMGGNTGTTAEQPGTVPDITRAGWNITQNFSLGWAGGNQWLNYTRQIPANTYQVWASLSYGGSGANLLQGNLLKVTSGATTTTQVTEALGVFRGPGTGGWGSDALVPLRDSPTNSAIKTLQLSGETTLRFENVSGDFDYLMLIPVGPSGPTFNPPSLSGSTLTITWTGTGLTLEQATALTGTAADWSAVPGNPTSPFTVNVGTTARTFYRLKGAGP